MKQDESLKWQCCTCGYPNSEEKVKTASNGDMYCQECYQEWLEDNSEELEGWLLK